MHVWRIKLIPELLLLASDSLYVYTVVTHFKSICIMTFDALFLLSLFVLFFLYTFWQNGSFLNLAFFLFLCLHMDYLLCAKTVHVWGIKLLPELLQLASDSVYVCTVVTHFKSICIMTLMPCFCCHFFLYIFWQNGSFTSWTWLSFLFLCPYMNFTLEY